MQWQGAGESENLEDRRGISPTGMAVGGGGSILVLLLAFFLGADPRALMEKVGRAQQGAPGKASGAGPKATAEEEEGRAFTSAMLRTTEQVWDGEFQSQLNKTYRRPKLVLFRERVESGCGLADAGMGPFYCPADQKVYLDLSFFKELETRFQSPGRFPQSYVIAHEIGHHVQNLLGYTARVHNQQGRISKTEYNKLSVRLELQADFLAGVWGHHVEKYNKAIRLEPRDFDQAIKAAQAIGDDALQKRARGYVQPESFTHGTSDQRKRWFTKGFKTGRIADGNTFDIAYEDL